MSAPFAMELKRQIQLMPVEMVYKDMVLVDLNKVLRIIDAETPEDTKVLLKQDVVSDSQRIQEAMRRIMRTMPESRNILDRRDRSPQDTRHSREYREPEYLDEHG